MARHIDKKPDSEERLPPVLVDALRAADKPVSIVTARVDRDILAEAERQFSARKAPRRRFRLSYVAAAASVVLVAIVLQTVEWSSDDTESGRTDFFADIDGSGRIDIADVLALARRDAGAVTAEELDAFAQQVVSLKRRGDAT